jgi:sugar lactone lactonase YvrE
MAPGESDAARRAIRASSVVKSRTSRAIGRLTAVPGLPVLLDGVGFGEAPRWRDGRLWFSDFHRHAVSSVDDGGSRRVELEIDEPPSGLGWLPDGRLLVVAMESRRVLRVEHDGRVVTHADLSSIATGNCNDMVVASDGTAYVGNFGFDLDTGEPRRATVLARVAAGGDVSVAADGFEFPNGSVITPDGRTLIVGETMARRVTALTIAADGTLHGRRVWAELGDVMPDGCTLDAEGAIWFADAGSSVVVRIREGGAVLDRIDAGQRTFACALGGDDGRTLFVLCADGAGDAAATPTGTIRTHRVDVPHAGLP